MTVNIPNGMATHFGRQLKKERTARGWSVHELSRRTGIDAGHLSRIERGLRPPTKAVALACDHAFPERDGWFAEYYDDSSAWMPPGFRSWGEHEDSATHLWVWSPGQVDGLAQTEDYARATLRLEPGATDDQIEIRLKSRMERQRRVLHRDEPPVIRLLVDQAALYREVGGPRTMAGQMRHLVELGSLPHVTVQVLPQVGHPATGSELILTTTAAYVEHLAGGYVYSGSPAFTRLETIMTTIAAECYRASESQTILTEAAERWDTQ